MKQYINGTTDWFICTCGNTPMYEGFYTCLRNGSLVSPTLDGEWDGSLHLCERCKKIIDAETLEVIGVCEKEVIRANAKFDWDNY